MHSCAPSWKQRFALVSSQPPIRIGIGLDELCFGMQRKVPLLPKVMQLFEIMARVGESVEEYAGDESEDPEPGLEYDGLDK